MFPNAGVRLSWGSTEASNITSVTLRREDIKNDSRLLTSVGKVNSVAELKLVDKNVYAQEVEQDLLKNPAISECAVIGVPDRKYGEEIAAAIVLKKGCTLGGQEFISFCREVMPLFKKPKYWAFMEQLPKNDVGKVQKAKLREHTELFPPVV